MDAIESLNGLVNRKQRRRFEKEALKVIEELEKVNTSFLYYLFDDDDLRTYKELYEHFNILWHEGIKSIIKRHKIETIAIDLYWFSENYKPRENV